MAPELMVPESTTMPQPQVDLGPEFIPQPRSVEMQTAASSELPAIITKAASKQAYYTIRILVDGDRKLQAYRAYAYFRWVDDCLDGTLCDRPARLDFIGRQRRLFEEVRSGRLLSDPAPEEQLVVDLLRHDDGSDSGLPSGLQSYINHMLAVMDFDAHRRGRWVTAHELEQYTQHLSIAVTDALHYFIGHDSAPPRSESRYLPVMAAHVTHMLRDTYEDVALGYFNVPSELLESHSIDPRDVQDAVYRAWVRDRVALARSYFKQGAHYLDQIRNLRCRLAGYAYMARFAGVLDAIEQEGFRIRPAYPEFKRPGYALRVGGSVVLRTLLGATR